jgi:uncharacterized protein YegL
MTLNGKIQSLNNAIQEALPHMRAVAGENPNAGVMVRTLRFSSGARWIEPASVPLDQYQWTTLQADDLPRGTAAFAAEFRTRLDREGAQSGDVQISLIWNNYNDLDLHVIPPSGEEISFRHKKSRCGGELDVDMNVSPTSETPVENVYWPTGGAPQGRYQVFVNHFKNHGRRGCEDPTNYRVAVSVGGVVQEFRGVISHGAPRQLVHQFDVNPQVMAAVAGSSAGNTDLGAALRMMAEALRIPPMTDRALPPVLVLVSDGQPTDEWEAGLQALMQQPWGKKSVRIAIAIGGDADLPVLKQFIGRGELEPLQANNPDALVRYIRWVSTAVLQSASAPHSQAHGASPTGNVPIPMAVPEAGPASAADVW